VNATLPLGVVPSQGRSAGLVSRTVADAIDVVAVSIGVIAGYLAVSAFRFVLRPQLFRWPQPGALDLALVAAVVFTMYLGTGWTSTGRTLGKAIMGLRVVGRDRSALGSGRAFGRAVLCVLFPVGLLWSAADRRERAVHDLLLGTSVVYDWGPRSGTAPRSTAALGTPSGADRC
jgi:uncharacterized RDD family membrane protein YckC